METAFFTRLTSQVTCPAAMGAAKRDQAPPYIVAQRVGGVQETILGGVSGYREQTVQLDVYGRSYAEALGHYNEAVSAFAGWSDKASNIYGCFVTPRGDAGIQADLSDAVFRMLVDVEVIWRE